MHCGERLAGLAVFCFCCAAVQAQPITFDLQTYRDCPLSLVSYSPQTVRIGATRRQFVTVRNVSDRVTSGMLIQQAVPVSERLRIIALERISLIIRPRESKRLSISIDEVWNRRQIPPDSDLPASKPVLSIVVADFADGSTWRAPTSVDSDPATRR